MRAVFAGNGVSPSHVSKNTCTTNARTVHLGGDLSAAIRSAFPMKTWGRLAELLSLSERGAKYKLAGQRSFTVEEIACLLRTEQGLEILAALMGNAQPRWWRAVKTAFTVADSRRAMQRQAQKLKEAINEYSELGDAVTCGEAALSIHDEEFYRPHFDALGQARSAVVRKGR